MAYTLDENTRVCTRDPIPFDDYFPLFGAPRDADFRHHDTLGSFNYNLGVRTDYFRMDTGTMNVPNYIMYSSSIQKMEACFMVTMLLFMMRMTECVFL